MIETWAFWRPHVREDTFDDDAVIPPKYGAESEFKNIVYRSCSDLNKGSLQIQMFYCQRGKKYK